MKLNTLKSAPLFWVLVPFLAGSFIAISLSASTSSVIIPYIGAALLLVAAGSMGFHFMYYRILQHAGSSTEKKYSLRWMGGLALFCAIIAAGLINVWLHTYQRPDFFANSLQQQDNILVQITDPLQDKGTFAKTTAKIIATGPETAMKNASGKIVVYFEKDGGTKLPQYGDQLLIRNKVSSLKPPLNPGEFDYHSYMSYKGIYHSAYLKKGEWAWTGNNEGNPFWASVYAINTRLKTELANALPDPEQRGIAEALVIGDESDVPNDVMNDYAGTGTVHILSVSGLHIGIILIGLSWIFSFLKKLPYGKYMKLVLILAIIWCYAFLTGFSAPIARSVIMFSIVFIGMNIGRRANIYNSICGSALVLLLIDPFVVMQASCQLSFIALTGIVWLQPRIAAWWDPNHKLPRYIWELAAASLAAQIITLPISIFYFNQLSLYFLPANLIVIPASFVVLVAGIAFVFVRMVPLSWLHHIFSGLLYGCIYVMNVIARFINQLPGATLQGLYLNGLGVFLLYLFIILVLFSIIYRSKKLLGAGLAFGLCFILARDINIYNSLKTNELNIMTVSPHHTVITLKDRNRLFVVSDTGFIRDKQLLKYHINGNAWQNFISPGNIVCLNSEIKTNFSDANLMECGPLIGFYNKRILMINSETHIKPLLSRGNPVGIDALVLYNNPRVRLADLYKKFRFKSVIGVSGQIRDWETECIENSIPFINLQKDSYFNIPI